VRGRIGSETEKGEFKGLKVDEEEPDREKEMGEGGRWKSGGEYKEEREKSGECKVGKRVGEWLRRRDGRTMKTGCGMVGQGKEEKGRWDGDDRSEGGREERVKCEERRRRKRERAYGTPHQEVAITVERRRDGMGRGREGGAGSKGGKGETGWIGTEEG